jgi:hypothetical protein
MSITIRERDVLHSRSHRREFINFPWKLYGQDSHWVPPLKLSLEGLLKPTHPFFAQARIKAFMSYDDNGKATGRIMAIINPAHNAFHEDQVGFFGFFESINDLATASALTKAAQDYLREQGCTEMIGPVNPSTNYECGLLIRGFEDSPQIMMTYNPTYYPELFGKLGFAKAKDILAYCMPTTITMPEVVQKIAKRTEASHKITYRPINIKDWDREIDHIIDIYNDAWEKNWGFIPMDPVEFHHTAKDLKSIADPRFILIAEVDQKPAAFLVCLPDYNQVFKQIPNGSLFPTGLYKLLTAKKRINRVRVITLGVKKEFRKIGLEALLYIKIQEEVLKAGHYTESEMSWILEDNLNMNKPLQRMGAEPYKTYRLYSVPLQSGHSSAP